MSSILKKRRTMMKNKQDNIAETLLMDVYGLQVKEVKEENQN